MDESRQRREDLPAERFTACTALDGRAQNARANPALDGRIGERAHHHRPQTEAPVGRVGDDLVEGAGRTGQTGLAARGESPVGAQDAHVRDAVDGLDGLDGLDGVPVRRLHARRAQVDGHQEGGIVGSHATENQGALSPGGRHALMHVMGSVSASTSPRAASASVSSRM
ncbi:hypothetical protein [Kitasatospora sp. NPDC059571]|uniref:hypothetical protein n=1 Tax=Kitasatospora sp. NPDC059571 TaxID=3346871 RepID=UPI00367E7C4B